jgi:hypothetical protein
MIPLNTVFWGLVLFFGMIGALRGWAKEILVSSSVFLAMFIQQVFGQYVLGADNPYLPMLLKASEEAIPPAEYSPTQFYVCTSLLLLLTFFGYAGPTLVGKVGGKVAREQLQDALLGFFLGLLNGFLIIGTLWFFVHKAGYDIGGIVEPAADSPAAVIAGSYLVPVWLTVPELYVLIAVAFVFIIIVFI